jgi:hypothetical protein
VLGIVAEVWWGRKGATWSLSLMNYNDRNFRCGAKDKFSVMVDIISSMRAICTRIAIKVATESATT